MIVNKKEVEAIDYVIWLSKGWPLSIYIDKGMAYNLVERGLEKWAMPTYPTEKTNISAVRITTKGEYYSTK